MRRDYHIPCSERTGTKQVSATRHDKEAEGTPQGLAFGPNTQEELENHQKQLTKGSNEGFCTKESKQCSILSWNHN